MKCPLCELIEVEFDNKDMFSLNCQIHGTSKITKEAIFHYRNFNEQKQKKITDYLTRNSVKEITTRTLDNILRKV